MPCNDSVKIAWLSATLGEKRTLVIDLFARMRGLAGRFIPGGMKESLFPKFMVLFNQISEVRDEEMHIINQIEDIEAKHRLRRQMKRLEIAETGLAKEEPALVVSEPDADRPKSDLIWTAVLSFMARFENNPTSTAS